MRNLNLICRLLFQLPMSAAAAGVTPSAPAPGVLNTTAQAQTPGSVTQLPLAIVNNQHGQQILSVSTEAQCTVDASKQFL